MSFLWDLSSFWMLKTFAGFFYTSSWLALTHPQLAAVQGNLSPFSGEILPNGLFAFQVDTPMTLSPSMDAPIYQTSRFHIPQTFELLLQTPSSSQDP